LKELLNFFMAKFMPIGKTCIWWKKIIPFLINLKLTFLTKSFNNFFWLPYWPSYPIDLICFIFVYIPTCLTTNPPNFYLWIYLFICLFTYPTTHSSTYPPIYLFIYIPTHLPTLYNALDVGIANSILFCDTHVNIVYFGNYC
jgi:hypothetical protein